MSYKPKPENCFLNGMKKYNVIDNRQVYISGRLLYCWDEFHGEIEVFDRRGHHLGVLDAVTGEWIRPLRKERHLNV